MSVSQDFSIKACVFDAYGTLFDFGSAAGNCKALPREKAPPLTALWRDKQLQYTWLRGLQGRHADFWQVTSDALDYALDALEINASGVREELMSLYRILKCFPEVPDVLSSLKRAGFTTAILSNGSPAMLAEAVEGSNLTPLIDHILSVEEVGVFKPHPSVYRLACERLGVDAGAISFQSSNAWDAYAASSFGMHVAWCNRYGQRKERLPGRPDWEIKSLSELPALLARKQ